ncbi:CBS domain-containing protein [Candidatus Nitrospira bockiana]
MKVKEVMTREVQCCGPHTNLMEAAKMMWDRDCGVLPVVNTEVKVLGMITDRDICMSVATKNRAPADITVWDTISQNLKTCAPDACHPNDDVREALHTMAAQQVRRLPVIDEDGILQGVLSITDLIRRVDDATEHKRSLTCPDILDALKAIARNRRLVAR